MQLYIAGGVHEHGRNCFLIRSDEFNIMLDCGVNVNEEDIYPHLSKEDIINTRYLFLSHSHKDHTGAITWIIEQGFNGYIIASKETFKQINLDYSKMVNIEEKRSLPIDYIYGKSGHCVSSVWYLITINNKNILYTGDYIENTLVYKCDWIRNINADMAIIDCTYGYNNASYQQYCKTLETITNKLSNNSILFPVPKSGRGIELLKLFDKLNVNIFADDNFINSLNIDHWYNDAIFKHLVTKYTDQKGIIFISDPQLLKEESQRIANKVLEEKGHIIVTGTIDENTYASKLIKENKMMQLRNPVHQNYDQFLFLTSNNNFKQAIAFHSASFEYPQTIEF